MNKTEPCLTPNGTYRCHRARGHDGPHRSAYTTADQMLRALTWGDGMGERWHALILPVEVSE